MSTEVAVKHEAKLVQSEDFFEQLHADALKLTTAEEEQLDRELRDLLPQNEEIQQFVKEYTLNLHNQKIRDTSNSTRDSSDSQFPKLERSGKQEPYTPQELFLRQQFTEQFSSRLGSQLREVYVPHLEVSHPQEITKMSVAKLLASGAHLGHSKSLYRSSNQQFIYGEYKGIHIIDLEKTLVYLKKACKVVEDVAQRGGVILFVGNPHYEKVLSKAADRCGGYYLSTRWTPGTLTNATEISSKWERVEVDMGDVPTGRTLSAQEQRSIVKPDLIVVLNPAENRVLLHEAAQVRVPTVGIIDTDSESSLVTYPIPANDDSKRAVTLLCGVLSKSAQRGYQLRLAQFANNKAEAEGNEQVFETV
jgi:ribosomal protein S2